MRGCGGVSQPSVHWAGLEKRVKKVWTDTGESWERVKASPSQDKVANTLSPYQEEEEVLPSRDKPQVSLFPPLPTRTRTLDPEFSAISMVLGQLHHSHMFQEALLSSAMEPHV
ncbi:hypothetical protein AB1E18_008104 [Capra hircus]